jgi:serine/threonine protein kinase
VAAPKKPANKAPVFGRWQGVRLLESGGFGQTIEVEHLDTKKVAIVKVIKSTHYGDDYEALFWDIILQNFDKKCPKVD